MLPFVNTALLNRLPRHQNGDVECMRSDECALNAKNPYVHRGIGGNESLSESIIGKYV